MHLIARKMNGKLIIVTGGTKGIGKAIIESFARMGADIVTCARNESELAMLKSEITKRYEVKCHVLSCDLAKKEGVIEFVEFIKMLSRSVDILVNNTGKFIPGQIHTEEDGVLEEMMDTNLYSAYHLSRAIIPMMKEQQSGHIFNMCSIASFMAYPNGGSYAITKFAMYGMSKVMREELKPFGIRVTSVMPGATWTASWEGVDLPEERLMRAEDVAAIVLATYQLSGRSVVEDLIIRPQLGDL